MCGLNGPSTRIYSRPFCVVSRAGDLRYDTFFYYCLTHCDPKQYVVCVVRLLLGLCRGRLFVLSLSTTVHTHVPRRGANEMRNGIIERSN